MSSLVGGVGAREVFAGRDPFAMKSRTDMYCISHSSGHQILWCGMLLTFAGMQGLDARSRQRQDFRSGAIDRSGGGG